MVAPGFLKVLESNATVTRVEYKHTCKKSNTKSMVLNIGKEERTSKQTALALEIALGAAPLGAYYMRVSVETQRPVPTWQPAFFWTVKAFLKFHSFRP